jgi:hypothetical protein
LKVPTTLVLMSRANSAISPGLPSLSTKDRPAITPAVFTLMWMLPNRLMAALTPADIAWLLMMSAPTPIAFPSSAAI